MRNEAQISYSSGIASTPLLGQTIGEMLDRIADLHPDREALVESASGRRWTFAQLRGEIDRLALGLRARGVEKGDRVGIWSPNCAEWVLTQYATARLGAILVNINPAYRTSEVEYVIGQSGLRLMVSAASFRTTDYAAMLAEVGFDDVLFIGTPAWDETLAVGAAADPAALAASAAALTFDQPINIQYTSGTTGFPKGATLSHHNILNNGFFVGEGVHYTEEDRVCVPVPLYHCFGMVMGVLGAHSHGACVVLPAPVFDPEKTLEAVHAERCTSLYGVPTMFIAELAHPRFAEFDLTSLRTGIMAGSPCPVEVMERVVAEMHMPEVAICYGMTETSPVSTMTSREDDLAARTQTIGAVMPFIEVKVVDEDGLVVPRGMPGEFCTRGYSVMLGYWNEPDKTMEAIDAGRWMHTGDIATMDLDGRLNIVGRIKDMILRGGENIYPREIEEFLYRHPDVGDVQVIGVPDAKYGEEVMAWIVMRPDAEPLTADAVREFATGRLAHFKIPRYVHLVDAFPMTVTGKVRKVEMREMAVEILGL
ncbi:AMP-binding protein [Microbacterium azadirachtae]|uniref:Long-chain-fatty-acid--CoA ligase FadD13 n=1 Tax=Microbacterium azadirachtae TaxID=582680 RepID=A0A0F0LLZ4_9MICO|nr:AMP-binding protein [Microbacterium azadirachtae]KJL32571.1 Long-chain-fatty-acid--CoA ligase FadD13 [Microbacterium azadirachtae]